MTDVATKSTRTDDRTLHPLEIDILQEAVEDVRPSLR